MSEFDKFAATYAEKAFNTKKTYNNAYKKLFDGLDQKDIHTCTSQEIFDELDKYESANTKQSLLNIAISVWRLYGVNEADLVAYRDDLGKALKQNVKTKNVELRESLPSYEELVKYTKECFDAGKITDYIVNFLILNFQVRNMDLNFKIVPRLIDATDPETNYMVPLKTKIYYIRNKYKTVGTYGPKQNVITDTDFIYAMKRLQAMNKDGHNALIPNENTIAYRIASLTYGNLGEGALTKIVINHFRNDIDELKKISENRGTAIQTLLSEYDIMV